MNTLASPRPYPLQTVSQLTAQIKAVLDNNFQEVAVVGEVSNFKRTQAGGHWYFSLKDDNATLLCACFRKANSAVKFELQDGLKVIARGKLEVYAPKGSYQLIVQTLEPVGIGQWQLAFEQLKEKLDKEGLLDAVRKRPIPLMPRKIAIVTSTKAAALRDVLSALKRRNPNVQLVIAPTRVQGEGVELEIAQAIKDAQALDVEAILVVRGGGSIEDLWCFNTEAVARAVSQARVPVISGVGHETDVTICDLVADLRAPTPTAAAELVCRGRAELSQRWSSLTRLLFASIEQKLSTAQRKVERLNPRQTLLRQQEKLQKLALLLGNCRQRLLAAVIQLSQDRQSTWHRLDEKLKVLSPLNVVQRGFAIVRRPDGSVIQDASQVKPGDILETWLHKGKLKVKVEECLEDWQS